MPHTQHINMGVDSQPARGRARPPRSDRSLPRDQMPEVFFFFFLSLSGLELSDTKVYAPYIRAASHFCEVFVFKLRTNGNLDDAEVDELEKRRAEVVVELRKASGDQIAFASASSFYVLLSSLKLSDTKV